MPPAPSATSRRAERKLADELERARAREEYICKVVDAAPPPTPEQIALIRRLMGPNSPAARAAAADAATPAADADQIAA